MKITKFGHACFIVENDDQSLIVDPGGYSDDLVVPKNVVGVVITHEHGDHLNDDHLREIAEVNPDVIIIGHQDIMEQIDGFTTKNVSAGTGTKIGNFQLEFFGGKHAFIYDDKPDIANLGVMINGRIYYPGDSFSLPERAVEILALPVAAPWMKLSEGIEFAREVNPTFIFPTHDAVLSDIGLGMVDRLVPQAIDPAIKYQRLHEPLDI